MSDSYRTFHALGRRTMIRSLHSHLSIIVAELAADCEHGRQGQTAYLVRPDQHDLPVVTAILRTRSGELHGGDLPWLWIRNPRIEPVPAHIAERCWTGTAAEMEALLATILRKHCPRRHDFGMQLDLKAL